MKYKDVINGLGSKSERKKISASLEKSKRNSYLEVLRDYVDGVQWMLSNVGDQTRFTRRNVEMWKPFDEKKPGNGFTAGELKVWNVIKPARDIYASYTRGQDNDDVKVIVKTKTGDEEIVDEQKSKEATSIFGDLNEWVINAVEDMSTDSAVFTKYQETSSVVEVMEKIAGKDKFTSGRVMFIDAMEMEPLYWHDMARGYIRFYRTTVGDILNDAPEYANSLKGLKESKEGLFWTVWGVEDNGDIYVWRMFDEVLLEEGKSKEYDKLPFSMQVNGKVPQVNFDIDNIERSDTDDLIELQDHLNTHLTTISQIHHKVAFPMLAIDPRWYLEAQNTDMEKLKTYFENMSTAAGSILFAPITKLPAEGLSSSQDRHIQDIFSQYYLTTGIPKSVFNSEGLANSSGVALTQLFESLRRRVSDKRTRITNLIIENVLTHFGDEELLVEVSYPDIFSVDPIEEMNMVAQSSAINALPKNYLAEKVIDLLGDEERKEELLAQMSELDAETKSEIETALATAQDARQQKSEKRTDSKVQSLQGRLDSLQNE